MKRLLLSLICCSPLLLSPSVSFSIDLTGPSEESPLSFEQYGPITPVETLWGISTKLRPDDSVSVQQTLVAIYKTNPYAFYDGNINKLIPQSIIQVPSVEFVQQQTNGEAAQLIKKYSTKKATKPVVIAKKTISTPDVIEETSIKENVSLEVDPAVAIENELNKERALAAEQQLKTLQEDVEVLNEQFIVATESAQALKLKLQPLNDKITMLSEQLEAEMEIQVQLQQIIDDYRAQLDAIKPAPFSGDGMLDKILHVITSSLTNLLIVILSPIILLLLLYVVISRIRSKRELAEQEKELAESTAILMEESGQFDALLTDDIDESENEEVDFSAPETNPIEADESDIVIPDELEAIDLTGELDDSVVDLTLDDELITEVDLDEAEPEVNEDDPFGISSLADEVELMPAVDLSDDELETSEDDPFGISALADEVDLMPEVDLSDDELETSEDDPFGIGALTEEIKDDVVEETATISAAEQADLDLAAEWEAQVSADSQNSSEGELAMSSSDIDDLLGGDVSVAPEEILEQTEQDSLSVSDDVEPEDLTEIEHVEEPPAQQSIEEVDSFNIDELDVLEEELSVELELPKAEETTTPSNSADIDTDIDDLFSLEETVDEHSNDQENALPDIDADSDLLAQQISDVAFNEEVALPEVGEVNEDDFIDIETLLENSGSTDKDEPYSELDLDLGLDEFPDVVELQENVDIDDDENGIGAQLDLARAYLEIDDKEGAKEILVAVVDDSNGKQRAEIDKLLSRLS